jgi:phosphoglycolate phosphatase-like HAD superfamily hydrolase
MNLAIFDIDGTLTDTNNVDEECFVAAFSRALSITGIETDWAKYPDTTDSGITRHIFQDKFGREPDPDELISLKSCFVGLLRERYEADSTRFTEIPGASLLLNSFGCEPEWAIAIATGAWRESASLKLEATMIKISTFPAAFADDGYSRDDILKAAMFRALAHYRQPRFEKIVSIGDGVWDVVTARRLGIAFLGIGSGECAEKLRKAGAGNIIENYKDYGKFLQSLEAALQG